MDENKTLLGEVLRNSFTFEQKSLEKLFLKIITEENLISYLPILTNEISFKNISGPKFLQMEYETQYNHKVNKMVQNRKDFENPEKVYNS